MSMYSCSQHLLATTANAGARDNVRPVFWLNGEWIFTTTPYAFQRHSGAPPG